MDASSSEVPNPALGVVKEGITEEVTLGRNQRTSDTYQAKCVGNSIAKAQRQRAGLEWPRPKCVVWGVGDDFRTGWDTQCRALWK